MPSATRRTSSTGITFMFDPDQVRAFKNAKKADPQVIGEALEKIRTSHGDRLKPEDVVAAARPKSNPLHKHFEWDDSKAAEAHRANQARAIIRVVRIAARSNVDISPRAFMSVHDEQGRAYRSAGEIGRTLSMQLDLQKQALRELKGIRNRLRDLDSVCEHLDVATRRLEEHINEMTEERASPKAAAAG